MGIIASLLARTGAGVEQLNAKHHWLRYVLLFGLLFARFGYELIGQFAYLISTYVLVLLYFWTIPKQERQQYNFTIPKRRIIVLAFAIGIIYLAVDLSAIIHFEGYKLLSPIDFVVNLPFVFLIKFIIAGIPEEMLFRGALWGEGRRINLSNFSILCIQAILFWGGHYWWYPDHLFWWILTLTVCGLGLGIVAWKTKSVLASAIVHAFMDCSRDLCHTL